MRRLLFIMAALLLVGCGGSNKSEVASGSEDILRVGMECGYAPYNWTQIDDANGAVPIEGSKEFANGYDVIMAKKVAEKLGKKLVVVKTEWDGLTPSLQTGKIDLIMAGMSPSAKRREEVDFTSRYWISDYVMIVKKGSGYEDAKSIDDFKGAKITGQLNTVHYDVIDQIDGVEKMDPMADFPQMRVALQSGIIDGYIGEVPEGLSVEAATDDLVMVKFGEDSGFTIEDNQNEIAAAVKKGNSDLLKTATEVFDAISDEERGEIMAEVIKIQPAVK